MTDISMTHTSTSSDLDRLAERVEKAAAVVQKLRDERDQFARERDALATRVKEVERKMQGQDAAGVLQELTALRKEQREWISQRRDVAQKIEALVRKLERIEA